MWWLLVAILFVLLLLIVLWSVINGISPMPSTRKQRSGIVSALPNNLQGVILELGSGWGTLAVQLAKNFPLCTVIGYENSPVPFFFSLILKKFAGVHNLYLKRRDFFHTPLQEASALICYLYPRAMEQLKFKLEAEVGSGKLVISNTFAIAGWKAQRVIRLNDFYRSCIYCYTIPERGT